MKTLIIIRNGIKVFIANKINIVLLMILCISFLFHVYNRNYHFQEVDSTLPYYSLKDFGSAALNVSRFLGKNGEDHNKLITKEFATNVFEKPFIANTLKTIFQVTYTVENRDKIIEAVEKISFFGYFRLGLSLLTLKAADILPGISDGFKLALTSTYSFGSGLIYGLMSYGISDYDIFMSRNLIITILLFHLSVFLLYQIIVKLRMTRTTALIASLIMLFSISFYSYGYHLGSTIWNIFTVMFFFYYVISFYENKHFYKNISILTAILVFFNYLIIFPWFALLLAQLYEKISGIKQTGINRMSIKKLISLLARNIISIVKEQRIALIFIILCMVLFFDPASSGHLINGINSVRGFWKHFVDLYYIVLNFISIYTGNNIIDIITFVIGFGMILIGYIYIFKNRIPYAKGINTFLKSFFMVMIIVFAYNILIFIPTRHMLARAPLVLIPIALSINTGIKFISKYKYLIIFILIIFSSLGFFCIYNRSLKTHDILLKQKFDFIAPYDNTIILDISAASFGYTNRYNFLEKTNRIRHFLNPTYSFFSLVSLSELKKGQKYFYAGQMYNLSGRLAWNNLGDVKYKVYNEKEYSSDIYFMANNKGSGSPYGFNFSNNAYIGEFELLE